jgi:hypothetical protein
MDPVARGSPGLHMKSIVEAMLVVCSYLRSCLSTYEVSGSGPGDRDRRAIVVWRAYSSTGYQKDLRIVLTISVLYDRN